MTLNDLLTGVEITETDAGDDMDIKGICLDSRRVSPGDAFFALPGVRTDGRQFIPQAIAAGAALVVSEHDPEPREIPHVRVPDARKALALAAANFYGRPARSMRMIGVTGTNGKTTVTHMLKGIFEKVRGESVGLIGTNAVVIDRLRLRAERTTPDALNLQAILKDMAGAGCARCVMEVSSHAIAQYRTWGIQFNRAVFTNLSQDHLDYHRDMEDYFETKARLFTQTDIGVINLDDAFGGRLIQTPDLNAATYSARQDKADVTAKNIKLKERRVEFEAVTASEIARIEWATPGVFSVYNALAAITTALTEGLALRDVAAAIRELPPVMGRMEVVPGPPGVTVIIDYAHTPDALRNVLEAARGSQPGRILTLFGCGGDRDRTKRSSMAQVAARGADLLFVTSDNPRTENPVRIIEDILAGLPKDAPPVIVEQNRRKAIERALRETRPGDLLLLCGKGHETYQEIDGQKFPLDEREVVSLLVSGGEENKTP